MDFIVIIPAYNAEKYLERCVRSVTDQPYGAYRIVIVDDGSADNTADIARRLARENAHINVLCQENGGQIAARSKGINYALEHFADDDSFFLFLDSDDELKPNALTRIAELIKENDCDLLIFGAERFDEATGRVLSVMHGDTTGVVESESDLFKIVLYDTVYNPVCFKTVSRRLIQPRDYSRYSALRYGEDLIQSLDYYRAAKRTCFSQNVLYRYYLNSASVTRSVDFYSYPIDSTVRRITWEFVAENNIWNEQELNEYAQFLLDMLHRKIVSLCRFNVPGKEKIKVFDKIQQDEFYAMLLNKPLRQSIIIKLLVQRRYKALMLAAKAARIAAHIQSR